MSSSDRTLVGKDAGLALRVLRGEAGSREYFLSGRSGPVLVGRDRSCQIRLRDGLVSRAHLEIAFRDGSWWIRDLNSANGTLVEGQKIDSLRLTKPTTIELGVGGPALLLEPGRERPARAAEPEAAASVTAYQKRYFGRSDLSGMGQHTRFIRLAFKRVQRKQKGVYFTIIASVAGLLVLASGYAYLQHKKVARQKEIAVDMFYWMKSLELRIAKLESDVKASGVTADLEQIRKEKANAALAYDEFIEKLNVYNEHMSEEEKLITRIARVFGECELRLPPGFVSEVQKYIARWKSSNRLEKAIGRASAGGYALEISREFHKRGLPDQFFYLAVQESDLDPRRCGPPTRFGFAKGMWQFIPDTALYYGLKTGPLVEERVYDKSDDRHDVRKSTEAAARYIRDIYDHDAQASGLLVMASYNWSERRVQGILRSMPEDPRQRNFWLLLEKFADRIPRATLDYIFTIFSAAVIGENPRLFGFGFVNPLGQPSAPEGDPVSIPEGGRSPF